MMSPSACHANEDELLATAERYAADLIAQIQPSKRSEIRRHAVARRVQSLIQKCFNYHCKVFTFGSVPLKTYLPDGDIDLTIFSQDVALGEIWHERLKAALEEEGSNRDAEFLVEKVQYIQAEVKLVKCLVGSIVVDISYNQLGGLCTLCFLEEIDRMRTDHLFKRSIILVKAWCFYEARILGAHHGLISTYALETLVLYIFQLYHSTLHGPLQVLLKFLQFFSSFDWDGYILSIHGPIPLERLANLLAENSLHRGGHLSSSEEGGKVLLNDEFWMKCRLEYSVNIQDGRARQFNPKHMNVMDPLIVTNNLGRSVSKSNFTKIRYQLNAGARALSGILNSPKEKIAPSLDDFFSYSWDRVRLARRPDVPDAIPSRSSERIGNLSGRKHSEVVWQPRHPYELYPPPPHSLQDHQAYLHKSIGCCGGPDGSLQRERQIVKGADALNVEVELLSVTGNAASLDGSGLGDPGGEGWWRDGTGRRATGGLVNGAEGSLKYVDRRNITGRPMGVRRISQNERAVRMGEDGRGGRVSSVGGMRSPNDEQRDQRTNGHMGSTTGHFSMPSREEHRGVSYESGMGIGIRRSGDDAQDQTDDFSRWEGEGDCRARAMDRNVGYNSVNCIRPTPVQNEAAAFNWGMVGGVHGGAGMELGNEDDASSASSSGGWYGSEIEGEGSYASLQLVGRHVASGRNRDMLTNGSARLFSRTGGFMDHALPIEMSGKRAGLTGKVQNSGGPSLSIVHPGLTMPLPLPIRAFQLPMSVPIVSAVMMRPIPILGEEQAMQGSAMGSNGSMEESLQGPRPATGLRAFPLGDLGAMGVQGEGPSCTHRAHGMRSASHPPLSQVGLSGGGRGLPIHPMLSEKAQGHGHLTHIAHQNGMDEEQLQRIIMGMEQQQRIAMGMEQEQHQQQQQHYLQHHQLLHDRHHRGAGFGMLPVNSWVEGGRAMVPTVQSQGGLRLDQPLSIFPPDPVGPHLGGLSPCGVGGIMLHMPGRLGSASAAVNTQSRGVDMQTLGGHLPNAPPRQQGPLERMYESRDGMLMPSRRGLFEDVQGMEMPPGVATPKKVEGDDSASKGKVPFGSVIQSNNRSGGLKHRNGKARTGGKVWGVTTGEVESVMMDTMRRDAGRSRDQIKRMGEPCRTPAQFEARERMAIGVMFPQLIPQSPGRNSEAICSQFCVPSQSPPTLPPNMPIQSLNPRAVDPLCVPCPPSEVTLSSSTLPPGMPIGGAMFMPMSHLPQMPSISVAGTPASSLGSAYHCAFMATSESQLLSTAGSPRIRPSPPCALQAQFPVLVQGPYYPYYICLGMENAENLTTDFHNRATCGGLDDQVGPEGSGNLRTPVGDRRQHGGLQPWLVQKPNHHSVLASSVRPLNSYGISKGRDEVGGEGMETVVFKDGPDLLTGVIDAYRENLYFGRACQNNLLPTTLPANQLVNYLPNQSSWQMESGRRTRDGFMSMPPMMQGMMQPQMGPRPAPSGHHVNLAGQEQNPGNFPTRRMRYGDKVSKMSRGTGAFINSVTR
ncbi:hypothetical protein CBR_g55016 [Chara braunii]|uniref:Polymerase nucleotidyl transferase domain-containing protein n=1 Tax=Chara braunii TaxID=69332 RepID=A0A388MCG0_CHABU|nr:hypothetical protein CBR_g55016 [Chara braunii]|eukprot:GBG92247.1 hypothetical protein CBR_g55016 [Chara braunii]